MNCKPGDLAYIVPPFEFPDALDHFVTVGERAQPGHKCPFTDGGYLWYKPDRENEVAWVCTGAIPTIWGVAPELVISDDCLRPIRDPGDDAVDETLLRLPAPREEVTL